jgi:hypothetical protein
MMPAPFLVRTTAHYERLARLLRKRQPKFDAVHQRAIEILGQDPTNRTGASRSSPTCREALASGVSPSEVSVSATTSMTRMSSCNIAGCGGKTRIRVQMGIDGL